jgi:hypothetical protein
MIQEKDPNMVRIRRSISFDEELLKWIDKQVNNDYRYKDRSHLIEILARQFQDLSGWNFVQTIPKENAFRYVETSENLLPKLRYMWVQNKDDLSKVDVYNKLIDPNNP